MAAHRTKVWYNINITIGPNIEFAHSLINLFLLIYNSENGAEHNVYYMIPFYITYLAFVPLHAKFSITVYRIGLRYRYLNNIISRYASAGE